MLRMSTETLFIFVIDKPVFIELNDTAFIGTEGDSLIVSLQAYGHPQTMTYTWTKNGFPLPRSGSNYVADRSTLNFTKLSRNDSGSYSCDANNGEGSATLNFTINVLSLIHISEPTRPY